MGIKSPLLPTGNPSIEYSRKLLYSKEQVKCKAVFDFFFVDLGPNKLPGPALLYFLSYSAR